MILPKGGIRLVGLLSVALLLSLACGQKEAESPSVTVGEAVTEVEDPSVTVAEAVEEAKDPSATVGEAVTEVEDPSVTVGEAVEDAEDPSVTNGEAVEEAEDPSVTVGVAAKEAEGPSVRIGEVVFDMEVAQTPEERGRGLSGRDSLEPGSGMLFVFKSETTTSFWMKGMRFPIDFVWIGAGCTVIDVTLGASAPPPGTDDSALPIYTPSAPVLYALEINAGEVAELGIEVGDPVAFIDFRADGTGC